MADWYTAMSWLSQRKKVRRAIWPQDCYILSLFDRYPIRVYTELGVRGWNSSVEDFRAQDWEVKSPQEDF